MPSDWSITEPQSLFTLPQPIDKGSGNTRAGRVYAAQGSRKRKRAEVVVGVDGECLNLYSIKNPRLLNTYPLPPQTFLTSPPVSFYRRASEQLASERFTYACIRDGLGQIDSRKLVCFQDQIETFHATTPCPKAKPLKWMRAVTSAESQAIHIEPLPIELSTGQSPSHEVLVVYDNGDLCVLSDDLQEEKLKGNLKSQLPTETTGWEQESTLFVELVSVQTSADGNNALLKARPDLAAGLDASNTTVLLVTSSKRAKNTHNKEALYTVQVFSIPQSSTFRKYQKALSPVWSCPLPRGPEPPSFEDSAYDPQFRFDRLCASLYKLTDNGLLVYDLSSTFPKMISQLSASEGRFGQLIPLPHSLVLLACAGQFLLYNVRYGSLQAIRKVYANSISSSSSRKRKRATPSTGSDNITLWFTCASEGVVLGLIGHDMVSMRVSSHSSRRLRTNSLLIDSLGLSGGSLGSTDLNVTSQKESTIHKHTGTQSLWQEMLSKLSALPTAEKTAYFDTAFQEFANIATADPEGPLASNYRDLALRAIRVIFEQNSEDLNKPLFDRSNRSSIKVVLAAPNTIKWLAREGYLGPITVGKALSATSQQPSGLPVMVEEKDLVHSVAAADSQLGLLAILVNSKRLGLTGLVASLKTLLSSFDHVQIQNGNGVVEAANAPTSEEPDEKMLIVEQEAAAHQDLQFATALLEDEYDARGSALKTSLERLGTCFSTPNLVEAFRLQMSQREIMMLVDLLRIELEQAGWTSRRLDFHPSFDETESQNEAIAVICKLLNCALDAMGATAWLEVQQLSDGGETSTWISLLRAQSSVVLEGVQECTFFTEFLKDFLRFQKAETNSARAIRIDESISKGVGVGQSYLPLGDFSSSAPLTRISGGGALRKDSTRRIGLELSRQVGKYTFESIRV